MQHLPTHPRLRHPLTGEPLRAVGYSRRGPIWPILGAAPDDPPADPPADDPPGDDPPADDPPEDWEGKFNSQRKINRKLERDSKPWFDALKTHGLSAEQALELINKGVAKPDGDGDPPVDADKIRREAERDADAKANARIVRSEVRALAAESFNNPADALHNVNLDDYEVDDNGELTDAAKVKEDLAQVLKENPHYAKGKGGPRPDPSQGPRGDNGADPGPGLSRLRHAYATTKK